MTWLDKIPYSLLVIVSLALGLAPFVPLPHVVEKLQMLFAGDLRKPVDIFDLLMHSSPMIVLLMKIVRDASKKS